MPAFHEANTGSHEAFSDVINCKSLSEILKYIVGPEEAPSNENELDIKKKVTQRLFEGLLENGTIAERVDESIALCDLGEICRQFDRWQKELPMVSPFYAVKCNPDPKILRLMGNLGAGFDCASKAEMEVVLSTGIDPSRIVFAHPCKPISHLRFAALHKVNRVTFDNVEELYKIQKYHPNAQLILRMKPDDSRSAMQFGTKFGVSLSCITLLLKKAIELELEVIGISFHVGGGCYDAQSFVDAVVLARKVFDEAEALNLHLRLLDIGGGFPGNHPNIMTTEKFVNFETIAAEVRPLLSRLFPLVQVIAEPGRYFVASAISLACMITSRRVLSADGKHVDLEKERNKIQEKESCSFMYYLNDGVYGSFNCIIFDHGLPRPETLTIGQHYHGHLPQEKISNLQTFPSSLWGPTCDSGDCISKSTSLPELYIGDWILFRNMGSYTSASASEL